jgi:hypothetical protein
MAIVSYIPDPANAPIMSAATKARLETMTDEAITAAAKSDPDNPSLTGQEIARIRATRITRYAIASERAEANESRKQTRPDT